MKRSTRVFAIVISLCVAFCVVFCMLNPGGNWQTPVESAEHTFLPTESRVKLIGRSSFYGGKRYFSYSGSGIEFSFTGEYVELTLFCDDIESISANHYPRYEVYLDGEKIEEAVIDTPEKTVKVNTQHHDSPSVITLIKQSEAKFSTFSLGSVKIYGKDLPVPTERKSLQIEFIGDSLTCGYGIDEKDPYGSFSTHTESFTGTYAYLTAKALDADYSAVCFSGYGVVTGYTENGVKYPDNVVSKYYSSSAFLPTGEEPVWDFSKNSTDIIVLNLGTNDAIYCSGSITRQNEFIEAYTDFLKILRMANPKAYILCVLGDVNNSVYPLIERAVSEYSAEGLDFSVGTYIIEFDMGNNDIVVDGHPGALSNIAAADKLTKKINELILQGKVGTEND